MNHLPCTVQILLSCCRIFGVGRILICSTIPTVECLPNFSYTLETKDVARADWLPFDLTSPSGLRIEVKSSAYLQAWTPEDVFSQISFDIAKKFAWDGATYASMAMRNSDLYVFCVFTARTRDVSILDLDYWDFYVLPTSVLNEKVPEQKTITLSSLLKLEPAKVDFAGLPAAVESVRLPDETT